MDAYGGGRGGTASPQSPNSIATAASAVVPVLGRVIASSWRLRILVVAVSCLVHAID